MLAKAIVGDLWHMAIFGRLIDRIVRDVLALFQGAGGSAQAGTVPTDSSYFEARFRRLLTPERATGQAGPALEGVRSSRRLS